MGAGGPDGIGEAVAHPFRLTFVTIVVMLTAGFLAAGLYPLV